MGRISYADSAMPTRWGNRRGGLTPEAFFQDIVQTEGESLSGDQPDVEQQISEDSNTTRRMSRRGAILVSTTSEDLDAKMGRSTSASSIKTGGSRESQETPKSRRNSRGWDQANKHLHDEQDTLKPPPSPTRKNSKSHVWFSGDLWKLNSGAYDTPTNLMNWRRRLFTLTWIEPLGLVLNYCSEKADLVQTLGCIIQGMGIEQASIATMRATGVHLDEADKQNFENGLRTYDIAVHKRSLHDACEIAVPSELKQIVIKGVDKDGEAKTFVLGWENSDALASWLMVMEAAVRHHFKSEVQIDHVQASTIYMATAASSSRDG